MGTDAKDLYAKQAAAFYAKQAAAFHAEDLARDFADAQHLPFFTELKLFLNKKCHLVVSDAEFKRLWDLGEGWHQTHTEVGRHNDRVRISDRAHIKLKNTAARMLTEMDLHKGFLGNKLMFSEKEIATTRMTLVAVLKAKGTPVTVDYTKIRDEYTVRLAAWWERVAGTAPTIGRDGSPFVTLCKKVMPSPVRTFYTLRRAVKKPVKKKGKGRGKSAIPERKKYRAVGT